MWQISTTISNSYAKAKIQELSADLYQCISLLHESHQNQAWSKNQNLLIH